MLHIKKKPSLVFHTSAGQQFSPQISTSVQRSLYNKLINKTNGANNQLDFRQSILST